MYWCVVSCTHSMSSIDDDNEGGRGRGMRACMVFKVAPGLRSSYHHVPSTISQEGLPGVHQIYVVYRNNLFEMAGK